MPQDVIDLISSSPPPPSPRRSSKQNDATSKRPHESTEAIDLNALMSEFNSTGDIDEPIVGKPSKTSGLINLDLTNDFNSDPFASSSPANHPPPRQHGTSKPPPPAPSLSRTSQPEASRPSATRLNYSLAGFDVYSDDFDTTGDLSGNVLVQSSGNKRRRLSPSPNIPALSPTCDAIDITSPHRKAKSPLAAHTTQTALSSQDPFASTPAKGTTPAPPTRSALERRSPGNSPNPFDSTPPKQDAESQRRRRDSPDAGIFDSSPRRPAQPINRRRRQDWDPISSSAPETSSTTPHRHTGTANQPSRSNAIEIESSSEDGSGDDDSSNDDLPDLNKLAARGRRPRERNGLSRSRSDVLPSKHRPKTSQLKKSVEERTREREAKAAAKEVEKEKKRIQREKDKEEKTREKERNAALAEVNKMRTDKKISTPEMLVDLPESLDPTIKTQTEALLEGLDVQYTTWNSPVEGAIKWRRKVSSKFNEDMGRWEPIPKRIEAEKHVVVVLAADKFVDLALSEELDSHVEKMEQEFPNHHILYLLEGMTVWMRKNRNLRNRQFTSGVRAQEATSSTSTTAARRRRNGAAATEYISEDLIEDALLQLQVMHGVLIHHTTVPLETAQWIVILTQHISTRPYKKQRDEATMGAGFCMESGQVRTGEDARDTFVRMLQEISRVTAPIAFGVLGEFDSVTKLVNGLASGGPDRLAEVRKSANKEGVLSDRAIGQAVSKRLHKVFTGRDENSADI